MGPELIHHPLSRADGSTIFSSGLYTIIAGVNSPVEVQRRDELPEEAAIEVNIRPAAGTGGPRERWLETVLHSALRSIVLVEMHPRTLIQITLQITKEPNQKLRRTTADIAVIPSLVNAAFTALVDGGVPLATTMSAALAVVRDNGEIILDPQEKDVVNHKSIHAIAHNAHGEQILEQSSGAFGWETWEKMADAASQFCLAAMGPLDEDAPMANGDAQSKAWLRQALQDRARSATAWREST